MHSQYKQVTVFGGLLLTGLALNIQVGTSRVAALADTEPSETTGPSTPDPAPNDGEDIALRTAERSSQLQSFVRDIRAQLGDDFVNTSGQTDETTRSVTRLTVLLHDTETAHATEAKVHDLFVSMVPSISPDVLEISYAPFSEKQLLAAYEEFNGGLESGDLNLSTFVSAEPDRAAGALRITLDGRKAEQASKDSAELELWAQQIAPVRASIAVDATPGGAVPQDSRESGAPAKAGRRTVDVTWKGNVSPSGFHCTLGLTVIGTSGPLAGTKNVVTAGHCGRGNGSDQFKGAWNGSTNTYYQGLGALNTFTSSANGGHYTNSDSMWLGNTNQNDYVNQVFVNSTLTRDITSELNPNDLTINVDYIVMSGATSGVQSGLYRGGPITVRYEDQDDPVYGDHWWRDVAHLRKMDYVSDGGDSGAPIYSAVPDGTHTPGIGIVSGRWVNPDTLEPRTVFNPMANITNYDPYGRELMLSAK